ncbi:MAG: hypothetical protein GY866_27800 [Proteobacteria bacterium]|nr:hypothetical protein [Pseudomonadota bacterium]
MKNKQGDLETMGRINRTIDRIKRKVPDRFLGLRVTSIVETAVFLVFVTLFSYVFSDGSRYFYFSPHPYWIIVLLVIVQYGTNEGLASSLLATLFLLAWNLPEQRVSEDMFDYLITITYRPFLWLIASVVLGEIRLRHVRQKIEVERELSETTEREQSITKAYLHLKEIKENLETRIASQLQGSLDTYQALKSIESLKPVRILMGVGDMVETVVSPDKFSVYSFGENGFEVVTSKGWQEEDTYSRRIVEDSPIYEELVGKRRVLCSVNKKDAKILDGEGIMAGPLIDPHSGSVFGLLKVEVLDFMDLTVTSIETFKILCEWAGSAYAQARKYQESKADAMHTPDTGLLSRAFCQFQMEFLKRFEREKGFDSSVLTMELSNTRQFSNEEREIVASSLARILSKRLPKHILLCEGRRPNVEYIVIMPGISMKGAESLQRLLGIVLSRYKNKTVRKAEFVFNIDKLGEM